MSSEPIRVLVTRPRDQAANIMAQLTDYGFSVVHFPVISIEDRHDSENNLAIMDQLTDFDLLIFISQNAVTYGLRLLERTQGSAQFPPVAAIGRSTRALLEANQIQVAVCPDVPNSVSLLNTEFVKALPAGSRVLIFRGQGGKETLAHTFRERRIHIQYAEVYRRLKPSGVSLPLADTQAKLIMVTSADSLKNLFALTIADDKEYLLDTEVIIGSESMAELYTSLGFKRAPITAASPLDEDMAAAAISWRQQYEQ